MGLDRLAWRTIASRPLRSLLTAVGIALGVGVLSASLAIGAGLDAAVERTTRQLVGRADLRVSGFLETGLSAPNVSEIAGTAGVETAAPVIEHRTFTAGSPGGQPAPAVTVLGIDPASYLRLHELDVVAGTGLLGQSGAVALVSEWLARDDGYVIGSQLTLLGRTGPTPVEVVGILSGTGPLPGDGRTVVVALSLARAAFGFEGVTRVDLGLADGAEASVRDSLAGRLDEPYILASPADLARNLRASSTAFQGTAALVAAVVLFVGAFLIINTLSMTLGERAREVGLLRAAGATRGQVSRFVFSGAVLLGLSGSLLGIAVGAVLSVLLVGSVSEATGLDATVVGIDPLGALVAAAVGLSVSILAAIEPAVRAAGISPIEALRARVDLPSTHRSRMSWIGFVFLVVAILALLAWPPAIAQTGADRAMAVYGVLLVATLLTPWLMRPLARLLGMPLAVVLRLEERLARGSLARDRSRTALTLGSLVIGLAMMVALGWSAQAARASAFAWLSDVMPGDEIVTSIRPIAADEGVRETLAAVPGVAGVTPVASFDLAFKGMRIDGAAIVGADFAADGRLTVVAGDREAALRDLDSGGAAILPRALASVLDLSVGDTLHVPVDATHALELRVAALVERSMPGAGGEAVLVGWKDAIESLHVLGADAYVVRFGPAATAADRIALRDAALTRALEPSPIERVQGAVADALARVFGVFDALALIALVVAALGIVNTLTMGVIERVREIGLLRAIGMSRRQVMRMVVVEAIVMGVVGVALGALTGLGAGALLIEFGGGVAPDAGVPWLPISLAAVLGFVLPGLAAVYPARAAARVSIVEALHFE